MQLRILVAVATFVGLAGVGAPAARGAGTCALEKVCCVERHSCCGGGTSFCGATSATTQAKHWSVANFVDTIMVNRTLVSGPMLIVHDDEKMARGEPCTTFYRFDPAAGPKEALVSFHCKPRRARPVDRATFTTSPSELGIKRLVEFQLGGDSEAHAVPR